MNKYIIAAMLGAAVWLSVMTLAFTERAIDVQTQALIQCHTDTDCAALCPPGNLECDGGPAD